MAEMETKTCFGCNQPTSNYKYEPETMRYYGADCLRHMEEHKLSPMEYNKCQGCGVAEIQCQGVLNWWEVKEMGGAKKLCFPCYQRTDEFKEAEKQQEKVKAQAEQEAKEKVEADQAFFKHKFNTTPDKLDLNKKYNCYECKKEIISNKDYDFFGVDLINVPTEISASGKKHIILCDSCYFNKLKNNDPAITADYQQWHNPDKLPIPKTLKVWNKRWGIEPKSKGQLKRETKEFKQHEASCLFCGGGLGWKVNRLEEIKERETINQAYLICCKCLTGEDELMKPDNMDLKMIRKSWQEGGMFLINFKKYPRPESLLLKYVEEGLKLGNLNVYWEDKKIYMEASEGGITIELNVYAKDKFKNWQTKTNYKGCYKSFDFECQEKHKHEVRITRTPFSGSTPINERTYKIENVWDNALSEFSDTNGYTMEEWEKDKQADQVLKNCADFKDYPKKGKRTDKIFSERDLKWMLDFENSTDKEKF